MTAASAILQVASTVGHHAASTTVAAVSAVQAASATVVRAASTSKAVTSSSWATNDAWLNGTATLVGAFVGGVVASWVAYALQVRAVKKKEKEAALLQAHQLMFGLINQINTIMMIWRDHFASQIDNTGRWFSVPAITPFDLDRYLVDESKMSILLDCKEGRMILFAVSMAQESYRETMFIVNERSRIHREEFQPLAAKSMLKEGLVTQKELVDVLGKQLFMSLWNMTDSTYNILHITFEKLYQAKVAARKYIVDRFVTDDVTDIEIIGTDGIEKPPLMHPRPELG